MSANQYGAPPVGPPPPFDPELAGPLREILYRRPSSLTPDRIGWDRERIAASRLTDDDIRRGGVFDLAEYLVPGPTGAPDVRLLVCRPVDPAEPPAVILHLHGGGMVAGHQRSTELVGELDRAEGLGAAVVSVEYRLAPEHPHPAPVEDCYSGLVGLVANAAEWGLDPNRVIISGASAGGALAAGTALLARDRGGPGLLGQMLLFPMLDDRCDTPSARQMNGRGLWDRTSNITGWTALLGDRRGSGLVSGYAAPARAVELSRLPPAFIDVGSAEALRDEAVAFATRIWQWGGQAELHVWSGGFHSFDDWVPQAVISQTARRARVDWLRRLLASNQKGMS